MMIYHGHGMTAEKILSNFTANPDIVYVAPQGLRDDFGDTGFISGRSARSKFTRYNAKGDEDYQLDDALRARFAHIGTWAAFGFSGGAGHLRDYAQERAFPYAAWCLSHNTLQSDQVGPDGKFAMFGGAPVPPTQQWLGLNDDKTGRVPPKLDYEPHIDVLERTFATTEARRKGITICGLGVTQRIYTNGDLEVYMTQGGHSVVGCGTDGEDDRLYRFVQARVGL
jgi:hypothetical protein